MAAKDASAKAKKKRKAKGAKKRLEIAPLAIIDNMVFSKNEAWAYYRLTNSVYDFLSNAAKVSVAGLIVNALSNVVSDRQEPVECHLIVASTPVDVDSWEDQVRFVTAQWNRAPGFERYVRETTEFLKEEQYLKKVTYLGINLGKRGALNVDATNFVEAGIGGAVETIKEWLNTALQAPGEEISEAEERDTRRKEDDFYRILSTGNLSADRVTAEDILLIIKRQFYPAMDVPYLDVDHGNRIGPGDLDLELGSAIENRLRWLKFTQMVDNGHEVDEQVGYRATLTISRLPREIEIPYSQPFMYFLHKYGIPFTSYARFKLLPNAKMKKELEKKKKEAKDELENISQGAETADSMTGSGPAETIEAIRDMHSLNEMLAADKNPWVDGVYRIIVETPDEVTLKKWCAIVKQRFNDIDVNMNWTVGDQAQLFLEQMPGDHLRSSSHNQITDLNFLGSSGFNYSSDVGDLIDGSDGGEALNHG